MMQRKSKTWVAIYWGPGIAMGTQKLTKTLEFDKPLGEAAVRRRLIGVIPGHPWATIKILTRDEAMLLAME